MAQLWRICAVFFGFSLSLGFSHCRWLYYEHGRGSQASLLLLILFNLHQMYLLGLDGSLLRAGYARLPHPCAG